MKLASAANLRFVVKMNILPKHNYKILLVKTYTFIPRSTTLTLQNISRKKESYKGSFFFTLLSYTFCIISDIKTRQALYVCRINEARSCEYCCSGNSMSITQPVCVFVVLFIHDAMRMRLPYSTVFFHLIS